MRCSYDSSDDFLAPTASLAVARELPPAPSATTSAMNESSSNEPTSLPAGPTISSALRVGRRRKM